MFKKYLLDTGGNIGIMFGLTSVLLVLGVGVALDTSGLTKEKATLQDMSDAATLAAVSSGETDPAILETIIMEALQANNVDNFTFEFDLEVTATGITLVVNSEYDTVLLGFKDKDKLGVKAVSAAPFGGGSAVNLALVLDSTLSMQGENMTNLKAAATNMVNGVEASGQDMNVSVVPFATYVKIDTKYRNESWTDIPDDYDLERMNRELLYPEQCTVVTEEREKDGITFTETRDECPESAYGPEVTTYQTFSWSGCMGSRSGIHREYPEHGSQSIPGLNHYSCGTPLLPLTNDYDNVRNTIDAMNARDNTYIPAGLIWGWRTLDKQIPFNEASLLGDRERAMVLMTDGHNVKSKGAKLSHENARPEADAFHELDDGEAADGFTAELCENIKNDGIRLFVISYKLTGSETTNTQTTLRNCASGGGDFFDAQNGVELNAAFKSIGESFHTVRLSR